MNIEENHRDIRLSSFNETYKSNLEDLMKRQDLQELYSKFFDDELKQAERYAKMEII
ncbi:MAG: hypothetical protein WAJ93_04920 [Candidatus Nitrosopolaris sp.]